LYEQCKTMTIRKLLFRNFRLVLPLLTLLVVPVNVMAQRFEIYPYSGGVFPTNWTDTNKLGAQPFFGASAGIHLNSQIEVEGNAAYIDHFRFQDRDMGARAMLSDVDVSYIFRGIVFNRFEPFVTFGIGNVKAKTRRGQQQILLLDPTFRNPESTMGPLVLTNGMSFLSLNYGGGLKAFRLWGPIGIRTDLRFRTMPDFFGHSNHWFEVRTGLNIAWGER
jgi:outer membrane protein with beta-barrel domain